MQILLKSNMRPVVIVTLPLILLIVVMMLIAAGLFSQFESTSVRTTFGVASGCGLILLICLIRVAARPRLTYDCGDLIVNLRFSTPIRIPVHVVECFFIGQSDAMLAGWRNHHPETVTLVVRLAENEPQWVTRKVSKILGVWSDGYIIIRGTWCEPLSSELVKELNSRLAAIHRVRKEDNTL